MDSKIIKSTDIRFKYLIDIFESINDSNYFKVYEGSYYYYIPPQLVLTPYNSSNIKVTSNPSQEWDNWVYTARMPDVLDLCCKLTKQEYYDLCVLHINDINDRPKCHRDECTNPLNWTDRLTRGYFNHGLTKGYCSKSCELLDFIKNKDYQVKANYSAFLSAGDLIDECELYLLELSDNTIKFGVTDINSYDRSIFIGMLYEVEVSKKLLGIRGTRYQVANLEAYIKLNLKQYNEFLPNTVENISKINSLISEFKCRWEISPFTNISDSHRSTNIIIHQMRSGSPDKVMLWTTPYYAIHKHDNCNLVDYTADQLVDLFNKGEYILPADEGDILHANLLSRDMWEAGCDQSRILLPQIEIAEDYRMVIPYNEVVPKNSEVYLNLEYFTSVKYPNIAVMTLDEFKDSVLVDGEIFQGKAIKTASGSGSRGVLLIDPTRVHLGGKYRSDLSSADFDEFCTFASKEDCNILIQDLIPNDPKLKKINVDFIIRNKKLLGYKWDIVNQSQQFTNWDNGYFHRSRYSDAIMQSISNYLIDHIGITDAIMNFEAFSDMESETWMIEFNWRYSNSMFEGQALGIDFIGCYLNNREFGVPYGDHRFSRYWQCSLYNNIYGYHEGI